MPADGGKLRIKGSARGDATDSGDDLDHDDRGEDDEDGDEVVRSRGVKYGSSKFSKRELGIKGEETPERSLADIPVAGAEADDEDDSEEEERKYQATSGKGTSYRKEGTESVRRRASQGVA